jgi:hypothetical protein
MGDGMQKSKPRIFVMVWSEDEKEFIRHSDHSSMNIEYANINADVLERAGKRIRMTQSGKVIRETCMV